MKSKSGNPTWKNKTHYLSGEDICRIISICAEKGVVEFQHGCTKFSFSGKQTPGPGPTLPGDSENVIREQTEIEKKQLLKEEVKTKEEQIAELFLMDPLLAEQLMEEGELIAEASDTDGPDDGTAESE